MMTAPDKHLGLTGLRTDELKNLLRLVYSNKLVCPFDKKTLMTMGFNRVSEFGECLCNLDKAAVRTILVAVLAERKAVQDRMTKLSSQT
ncbi:MAG: hypothetical protein ACPGQS_00260 [Bradymonadia bacterium]